MLWHYGDGTKTCISITSWSTCCTQPQHACPASPPWFHMSLSQECFSQHWSKYPQKKNNKQNQAVQDRKRARHPFFMNKKNTRAFDLLETLGCSLGCRLAGQLHLWRSVDCWLPGHETPIVHPTYASPFWAHPQVVCKIDEAAPLPAPPKPSQSSDLI